ncbi:MAG: hypothetical protein AABZ12_07160 [Planctomycetota bacterium]
MQAALACPIGMCAPDCDGNGMYDRCQISCSSCGDCNVPGCGQSGDCNGNGIPEECELLVPRGACCLPDDSCVVRLSACTCAVRGGTYVGDGTGCGPRTCLAFAPTTVSHQDGGRRPPYNYWDPRQGWWAVATTT